MFALEEGFDVLVFERLARKVLLSISLGMYIRINVETYIAEPNSG